MLDHYSVIDRWCYTHWGPEGIMWQQYEIGWLVKDYSDAVILVLIWDKYH